MIHKFGVFKPEKPDYIQFIYNNSNKKYNIYTTKEFKKDELIYKINPKCVYLNPINDKVFYFVNDNYEEVEISSIDTNNIFRFRQFDSFILYSENPNVYKIHDKDNSFKVIAKRDIDIGEILTVEYNLENI